MNQITSGTNGLPDTTNLMPSITNALAPFLLLSTIISILLVIAYIFSVIRRYKVEKAILAMQKDIHEMNERQRAGTLPASAPLPEDPAKLLA